MAETKKTKYDTNPLDPGYVDQVQDLWGEKEDARGTQEIQGVTREVQPPSREVPPPTHEVPPTSRDVPPTSKESARNNIYSEAPTRRYDSPTLDGSYPSVFIPPTPPQPAPMQRANPYLPPPIYHQPTSRTVAGIALPEKWAVMLPYAPFYIGIVASLAELLLVPRKEIKVRFHAAQGLALHIAIVAGQMLFRAVEAITDSSIGGSLFGLAATIFLIISMIRVWKGEPHNITPLAEPAKWLNRRIESRN